MGMDIFKRKIGGGNVLDLKIFFAQASCNRAEYDRLLAIKEKQNATLQDTPASEGDTGGE